MSAPLEVAVVGIGFWSPRLPGWQLAREVLSGAAVAPATPAARVAPAMLAPTERRRAPDTVAIALEVAARACEMAGMDPRALASVFASTHGDLPINDYMCSTLATTPALCSPTKFHNSVHNAASGYWTIGTGCVQPSTALTAWHNTFAAGLLEALVQAVAESAPVLYVAYDVASCGPLAQVTPSEGLLAVALVLDPRPAALHAAGARLECTVQPQRVADGAQRLPPAWDLALPDNAMRPCAPLFAALATAEDARLCWNLGVGSMLSVDVRHDRE